MALLSLLIFTAGLGWGQVSSNASLNGTYYFRHTMLQTSSGAAVTATQSASGALIFDGAGGFAIQASRLVNGDAPVNLASAGTYQVLPGGYVTLTNPLAPTRTINARLGDGLLAGSTTEPSAGATSELFDLLIAIPKAVTSVSNGTMSGTYWVTSLEFPNGGITNVRNTRFRLTANGTGAFNEITVSGQAANLGNALISQTVAPITYQLSPDATGLLNFPLGTGQNINSQLIAGAKIMAISGDGSHFIAGSNDAGVHGLVVGVRAGPGNPAVTWDGFFFAAGLRVDVSPQRLTASTAAVNATANGAIWARRTHQSDGLFDASTLATFGLSPDGAGPFLSTSGHVNVASTGKHFSTSGVGIFNSTSYELYFGARMPSQTGGGVFLHPQGVLNAGSFAPPGYPLSPGSFVTLFGTGLANSSAVASNLPFTTQLAGVSLRINGLAAPVYSVSPTQISAIIPYAATGSTASIVVTNNGVSSNTVQVPLAASSPGLFTLNQNGLGEAAALHLDYSVINASKPAAPGEIIQIYLAGMGAVDQPVMDGAPAPGMEPLARTTGPLAVTIGGQLAEVLFSGLAPTLAGLYQLNVRVPASLAPGLHSLAVQTIEGFTDMADLRVK